MYAEIPIDHEPITDAEESPKFSNSKLSIELLRDFEKLLNKRDAERVKNSTRLMTNSIKSSLPSKRY